MPSYHRSSDQRHGRGLSSHWTHVLALLVCLFPCPQVVAADEPSVDIQGIDGDLLENVRLHLSLARQPCDAPRWRIRKLFGAASQEIETALRAFGHYRSSIGKDLSFQESCWSARFQIAPGDPVRVRRVEIELLGESASDPAFAQLLSNLPLKQGAPLRHAAYEQSKAEISALAATRGYFDGQFTKSELRVEPAAGRADARLIYDSGMRYRFGDLRLTQDGLADELVLRLIDYEPDVPYESARLTRVHKQLSDSGYFSRVTVRQRLDEAADGRVPVDVDLDLKKRHRYSAGAGFSTDIGPSLKLGYDQRRVNRHGHRLSSILSASPVESSLSTEYQIPLANPQSDWLSLQAGYQREDTDTSDSDLFKLGANHVSQRPGGWLRTAYIEFQHEQSTVGDEDLSSTLLMPGVNWSRTRIIQGDSLFPKTGYRAHFGVRGSDPSLGSDTAFVQFRTGGKAIWSPAWLPGRLISRADIGLSLVGSFDELPASQRFFAGGDNSVRGYGFKELGPTDSAGEVIGGQHLLVGSLEYEHPIREKWSIAAFLDSGNALNDFGDDLNTGVGLGLRWRSPIGPIRVDLAHPLDDPDTSVQLHISMGPDL